MTIPPDEYDREELSILQRRLASLTDPSRQVPSTLEGREYRHDRDRVYRREARGVAA